MRRHGKRSGPALARVYALGAVLLLLMAGCTGRSPRAASSSEPGPSSAKATPTVDPSVAAATGAAVAAYNGYLAAFAHAAQAADPDDPNLARYVADPLLSLTRHNLRAMRDRGQVQVGAQTATVTSTRVDLAGAQPAVTIHACLEYGSIRLVYRSNHSPVPDSDIKDPKVSAVATVWLYKTGQWLVNDTKQGNDPC